MDGSSINQPLDSDAIEICRATAQTEVHRQYSKDGDVHVSLKNKVNKKIIYFNFTDPKL